MASYSTLTMHTTSGKEETLLEMLKSFLAQLQFKCDVMAWESKGVPFCSHLYVPEVHPLTGLPIHEREDEAHVFKVFTSCYNNFCVQNYHLTTAYSQKST